MIEAHITGELLRWARERRGLDYAQLARAGKIDVEELRQWEDGFSWPPFGKARRIAQILKIPFGLLFLPSPPNDSYSIPDFRRLNRENSAALNPDLVDVINLAVTKQEWFRDYCEENSQERLDFVGSFKMQMGVQSVAEDIRTRLGINEGMRRSCPTWAAYLSRLSEQAQNLGVLVMRSGIVGSDPTRPLRTMDFRGFALSDAYAPVVFINARDAYSAQVFTLIHELCHIWINQSGISNPDPSEKPQNDFEAFCDAVATEVLVPAKDFIDAWELIKDRSLFPASMSRNFWVSPLVIIRRAFELVKITDAEFFRLIKIEKDRPLSKRKRSGGNANRTLLTRNGIRLTRTVLDAVRENRLVYADAASILNVRPSRISKLLEKLVA